MRPLTLVVLSLVTASAVACPDIAGKYSSCKFTTGETVEPNIVFEIKQSEINGKETLTVNDGEGLSTQYVVGKPLVEVFNEDGLTETQSTLVTCDSPSLYLENTTTITSDSDGSVLEQEITLTTLERSRAKLYVREEISDKQGSLIICSKEK